MAGGLRGVRVGLPAVLLWSLCWILVQGRFLRSQSQTIAFEGVWNSPTIGCEQRWGVDIPISEYGITENTGGKWKGDRMVIFNEYQLGFYPYLTDDGKAINGGIPQLTDFEAHFAKTARDINEVIPDKNFTGYGVIDWEKWRPVYDRNWDAKRRYQEGSVELVREQHPEWSEAKLKAEAKLQFEKSARSLMEETLLLARDMRPNGKWGFYGFPRCYNHDGSKDCEQIRKTQNEQLSWLFQSSTTIYPSGYIGMATVNPRAFVHGQIQETLRIRDYIGQPYTPVFLYTRYTKGDYVYYSKEELQNSIQLAADSGLDGAMFWGSSAATDNKTKCEGLQTFMKELFGPFVQNVFNETDACSKRECNGNGRCFKTDPYYTTPEEKGGREGVVHGRGRHWRVSDTECSCYEGWMGTSCGTAGTK